MYISGAGDGGRNHDLWCPESLDPLASDPNHLFHQYANGILTLNVCGDVKSRSSLRAIPVSQRRARNPCLEKWLTVKRREDQMSFESIGWFQARNSENKETGRFRSAQMQRCGSSDRKCGIYVPLNVRKAMSAKGRKFPQY